VRQTLQDLAPASNLARVNTSIFSNAGSLCEPTRAARGITRCESGGHLRKSRYWLAQDSIGRQILKGLPHRLGEDMIGHPRNNRLLRHNPSHATLAFSHELYEVERADLFLPVHRGKDAFGVLDDSLQFAFIQRRYSSPVS